MTLSPAGAVEVHPAGRDREWQHIEDFVGTLPNGARSLIIRGEAGIGKTLLWRAALDRHRAAGHRVLVTRPAEEELHGLMVGLIDLFEATDPEPGTLDPDADIFDRGRAVLRTIRGLAASRPLVLAVDDVQWLDPVSSRSLRYALRRLDPEPVGLLATQRSGPGELDGAELHTLERIERIDLGPLPLEGVRHVVGTVLDSVSRPVLECIHELSAGNPMYAIELARSGACRDPLGSSPPPTLSAALSSRLADVGADLRQLLGVAAALGPTGAGALVRAADRSDAAADLALAVDRGLLVVDDNLVVRFTHPLLASVVLDGINPLDRRALHARLVGAVDEPDARARHLALSSFEPDPEVAAELEAAADRASRRGASALAAELITHARRVTPPDDADACSRRDLAEIAHRAAAGETARALALADGALTRLEPGRMRVAVVTQRVFLDTARSEEFLDRALVEIGDDELLQGRVLDLQGWIAGMARGHLQRGMQLSSQALEISRRHRDSELEMLAAGTLATTALFAGRPQPDILEEAMAIADRRGGPRLGRWPQVFRGRHCLWGGQLTEARERFEEMRDVFVRSGSEFQRPYRLHDLALLEIAAGNLDVAAELVDDGLEAAIDAGNAQALAWLAYPDGLVHVHRGSDERARRAASHLAGWGQACDEPPRVVMAHHVRGVLALAAGEPQAALAELGPGVELAHRLGYRHPGVIPVLPDAIEAAALAGDADRFASWTAELDAQARALGLPWVDAAARRARALDPLMAGRPDALEELGAAATAFDDLGYRLDAARTLLMQGQGLRRAGRRTVAAEVLATARDRFVVTGARAWASRAVDELERVAPGRSVGELTPTEVRVAELVAAGRRNREIAAELYISVATVEAHLTRMYRKLGVRSRTELTRVLDRPAEE